MYLLCQSALSANGDSLKQPFTTHSFTTLLSHDIISPLRAKGSVSSLDKTVHVRHVHTVLDKQEAFI